MDIFPEHFMIDNSYNHALPLLNDLHENGSIPFMPFDIPFELDNLFTDFDDNHDLHDYTAGQHSESVVNDQDSESVAPDLDNKLLGFDAPRYKQTVLDQNGQTWPRLVAELNGMFCVAEDVFEGETAGRPLELTCYRRNLFQISGSITISRSTLAVIKDKSQQLAIWELSAHLTATESIDGKSAELISVPWKTGPSGGNAGDDKAGTAPAPIQLDLNSNQESDPVSVTIPLNWARLQFKVATANNGRRKGLQQHYRLHITLMAKLEDGQMVNLVEIQSNAPVVVRGRSPKNFDSSKDVPLNERRAEGRPRTISSSATHWIEPALQSDKHSHAPRSSKQSDVSTSVPPSPSRKGFATTTQTTGRRKPPVPAWGIMDSTHGSAKPMGTLSLSEDEALHTSSVSVRRASVHSPTDTPDLLYEYFPLNLDDWLPPVDAIYRPHVVHHLKLPAEVKALTSGRAKPKRYFSADD